MANIEITDENVEKYKKLLKIKEGKRVSNNTCIYVPVTLLILISISLFSVTLLEPYFLTFMPKLVSSFLILILYLVGFGVSTKLAVELSKGMSLHYFKEKYSDIDTNISTKELKALLNDYRHTKYPEHTKSRYDTYTPKESKKKTLKDKKRELEKEKEFLSQYNQEEMVVDKVIKKKK